MNHWKCLNEACDENNIYNHKGLCRSCTIYADDGTVMTPSPRTRVNQDGSPYQKIERVSSGRPITRREQTQLAREYAYQTKVQTKVRKARQAMKAEGINPEDAAAALLEQADHVHGPDCGHDFEGMEIGESVGLEEE